MEQNNYSQKKLFAFDVDGTLSNSRSPIDTEMADLLKKLLALKKVAIITGGAFADIEKQVLNGIGLNNDLNKNLILLPTNGSGLWVFDNRWEEISIQKLTDEEKDKIIQAIKKVEGEDEELRNITGYGPKIQDREAQITYSTLGDQAPLDLKYAWDPDLKKRILLQKSLQQLLPDFEVKIGGKTSIDITQKGIDKAYALDKVINYLQIRKDEVVFFGDAVYENGNDYPAFLMGIETIRVINPDETKERLIRLLREINP
jgi:HAD superfamily hydrolase (TIGR01484 family)